MREEMLNHPAGQPGADRGGEVGTRRAFVRYFSRLLKDRIIMFAGGVDDTEANIIITQMLFVETKIRRRTFSSTSTRRAEA